MTGSDPYLSPDANVLQNAFGEKNNYRLQECETFFSALRICELIDEPLSGTLDYGLLKKIHAYVFQDIYPDWAGTTRRIKIYKKEKLLDGDSVAYVDPGLEGANIEETATLLFEHLEKQNFFKDLDKQDFSAKLADFLSALWQLHPFREGNTRTIMVICHCIALQARYLFSLDYIDKNHKQLRQSLVYSTIDKTEDLHQFVFRSLV